MAHLKLLLIRHAESIGNTLGIMQGQTSTALSQRGQQQCQLLADALAATPQLYPNYLYSSPLLRAQQTGEVLLRTLPLQSGDTQANICYEVSPALQEIHQGVFEGLTWSEAQTKYPELCQRLLSTLSWQPVPQAESLSTARDRAERWLHQVLKRHQPGETIWAISHMGLMQQLVAAILGCDRTWKLTIGHTGIFEFWLAATDWQSLKVDKFNPEYWIIRRFNDCSHLAGSVRPMSPK